MPFIYWCLLTHHIPNEGFLNSSPQSHTSIASCYICNVWLKLSSQPLCSSLCLFLTVVPGRKMPHKCWPTQSFNDQGTIGTQARSAEYMSKELNRNSYCVWGKMNALTTKKQLSPVQSQAELTVPSLQFPGHCYGLMVDICRLMSICSWGLAPVNKVDWTVRK